MVRDRIQWTGSYFEGQEAPEKVSGNLIETTPDWVLFGVKPAEHLNIEEIRDHRLAKQGVTEGFP